jgi:hypothetical protein
LRLSDDSPSRQRPWGRPTDGGKEGPMLFFGRKKRLIDYASCAG